MSLRDDLDAMEAHRDQATLRDFLLGQPCPDPVEAAPACPSAAAGGKRKTPYEFSRLREAG